MAHTHTPERDAVKKAYPSRRWATRVDKMDDQTVYAIFTRLKAQNKITGETK